MELSNGYYGSINDGYVVQLWECERVREISNLERSYTRQRGQVEGRDV